MQHTQILEELADSNKIRLLASVLLDARSGRVFVGQNEIEVQRIALDVARSQNYLLQRPQDPVALLAAYRALDHSKIRQTHNWHKSAHKSAQQSPSTRAKLTNDARKATKKCTRHDSYSCSAARQRPPNSSAPAPSSPAAARKIADAPEDGESSTSGQLAFLLVVVI